MRSYIPVTDGDTLTAIRAVLAQILSADDVDAVMVPMREPNGAITPALVTDPALLDQADPLAPVMPLNSARLLGWMTQYEPRAKIAAVMRSCEMRALIELVKLQQASLDGMTLISVDCMGTLDVPQFLELSENNGTLWKQVFSGDSDPQLRLRDACTMCEQPTYEEADIVIELLAADLEKGFYVSAKDEVAAKFSFEGDNETQNDERSTALDELIQNRTEQRNKVFAEINAQMSEGVTGEGLSDIFSGCIRCHNCMTVCPICYCKTCLFKGPVFDHQPIQYFQWAKRKGASRLPTDTMLFHLTRMNHMALSCVGCGMCTSVCPSDIPVGRVFRTVGDSVQKVFEYRPGFEPEQMLPLVAFEKDEWQEVGE